jgi:ribonuclease-3
VTTSGDWCTNRLGYQFSDRQLLERALTHRSASTSNNERLEFLGDAVLGLEIAHALYKFKPDANEGSLSRFRAGLVRRETLAEVAREIEIGAHIEMGAGERRSAGNQRTSVLANALEAVIGAVFLDGGYAAATEVVRRLYVDRLHDLPDESDLIDAKTRLQEYLQARQLPPPAYEIVETSGADHARVFDVTCRISAYDLEFSGHGTSRRRAEQDAAAAALEKFKNG